MQVAFTPRSLQDPGPPTTPEKTLSRWTKFLGSIATGTLVQDAMMQHHMTRADIEACIRHDPAERQRWDEAKLMALKRGWSAFDFDDIFERIAGGMPVREALGEVKGDNGATYANFNRIIIQDPQLNEMYLNACKARALVLSEEIIDIADDSSNDMAHNDKGGDVPNNAAVNRSKLKVETRARLMSAWHTKMFGEGKGNQVNVQVNVNHAERLEQARVRAKTRVVRVEPKRITQEVLDAEFDAAPAVDPKDDPMDTTWLEEK